MTKLQLPFLHLRHINNQHTWAYSVLQHIQTFLKKKNNHINVIIPTCLFPPQLKKLTNCHYMTPQLYQLDDLFPKFWDVKVSGGMIYFLTRFKTISNDSRLGNHVSGVEKTFHSTTAKNVLRCIMLCCEFCIYILLDLIG